MAYLEREDGKQVYYEDYGFGDSALVLIHGWGMSVRTWDHVVPAVSAAGHRIVLMDHRGCGRSDMDFDDMGIKAIAGDIVALVDHLGLANVILNGWSLGGAVVVEAASRLGERCNALVLTGGATPIYVEKPDLPLGGTAEGMAETLAALNADRVNFFQGLSQVVCAKEVGETIENWFRDIFLESSPLAGQTLAELADLDQREILLNLDLPILSFVGDQDGFVAPDIPRWVADKHPRTKLVEYEGVGHAPFIEEQADYLAQLLVFVSENG
jgi:pimeloyl-[acyl-carrier protein] methyl ester esterase